MFAFMSFVCLKAIIFNCSLILSRSLCHVFSNPRAFEQITFCYTDTCSKTEWEGYLKTSLQDKIYIEIEIPFEVLK